MSKNKWSLDGIKKAVRIFLEEKGAESISIRVDDPSEDEVKRVVKLARLTGHRAEAGEDGTVQVFA